MVSLQFRPSARLYLLTSPLASPQSHARSMVISQIRPSWYHPQKTHAFTLFSSKGPEDCESESFVSATLSIYSISMGNACRPTDAEGVNELNFGVVYMEVRVNAIRIIGGGDEPPLLNTLIGDLSHQKRWFVEVDTRCHIILDLDENRGDGGSRECVARMENGQ
ncbi:hypothetical protein BJV78DRAFT_1175737 [Lactifluus subvellereus]|nr:hypothetical protein BJV78DRAFT_1175737 [Lactifluus subvellereus]